MCVHMVLMLLISTVLIHVAFIDGMPKRGENVIFIACLFSPFLETASLA